MKTKCPECNFIGDFTEFDVESYLSDESNISGGWEDFASCPKCHEPIDIVELLNPVF